MAKNPGTIKTRPLINLFNGFDDFNPLSSDSPIYSNIYASEILLRARRILRNQRRTSKDIALIANSIGQLIIQFFEDERKRIIKKLWSADELDWLVFDKNNQPIDYTWEAEQHYEILNPGNTSDFEALKTQLQKLGAREKLPLAEKLPNLKPEEFFATLAIYYVAKFIAYYSWVQNDELDMLVEISSNGKPNYEYQIILMAQAMESISFAEQIESTTSAVQIVNSFEEKLFKNPSKLDQKITVHIPKSSGSSHTVAQSVVFKVNTGDIEAVREDLKRELMAQQSETRKAIGLKGKAASLKTRDASKKLVLDHYDKTPALQKLSLNKAATDLHNWLLGQKQRTFEVKTITGWLSTHVKETRKSGSQK